jgi:hypothetical protein
MVQIVKFKNNLLKINLLFSLAIIYGVFSLSNLFSADITHRLGARYTMTLGSTVYAIFQVGFVFLNQPYLYISSILLGIGASSKYFWFLS